ncbi:MAG: hypothetical protein H7337_10270 [Rhizobacter sp.]|nr:hypothetical protein [Rhizobacter sp.]
MPIDLFNKIHHLGERTVDLYTLIYPQTRSMAKMESPISGAQWVHPSQVISQFTYLAGRSGYVPPAVNNLIFIPYFMHLADHPRPMHDVSSGLLNASSAAAVPFFGHTMDMRQLPNGHFHWIAKQVGQLERTSFGAVRCGARRGWGLSGRDRGQGGRLMSRFRQMPESSCADLPHSWLDRLLPGAPKQAPA